MPRSDKAKRLIFLHIGRTGGTTLRQEILYRCVDRRAIFCLQGDEAPTQCGSIDDLLNLPRAEQEKLSVVVGHMPFGLRERLPCPDSWHYATFLRDPIARTVSGYYQARDSDTHKNHEDALRLSLEDYVRSRAGNGMCRILCHKRVDRKMPSDEAIFLEAWRNAKELSFVGLAERYDESVRRLCRMFGWSVPRQYKRLHALTPPDRILSPSELEALRSLNIYDQVIYDHFHERFTQRGQEHSSVLSFLDRFWPGPLRRSA